ncbi:hypothetical protein BpHYR1_032079 [Brachionus plicatilis]|uniref:Uncharacterized protein n=1 Tax=Brachionus plicatilis TaxID=10195 RepID=A0A3M7T7I2_BRAPC|nr:hypothetical protein BpHYR1_032079 [Brachionus plicatilis]
MTQSCPNISVTHLKKSIRDYYLVMHDVGRIKDEMYTIQKRFIYLKNLFKSSSVDAKLTLFWCHEKV